MLSSQPTTKNPMLFEGKDVADSVSSLDIHNLLPYVAPASVYNGPQRIGIRDKGYHLRLFKKYETGGQTGSNGIPRPTRPLDKMVT